MISEAVYLWLHLFLVWPLGRVCGRPSDPRALRPGNHLLLPTEEGVDFNLPWFIGCRAPNLRTVASTLSRLNSKTKATKQQ